MTAGPIDIPKSAPRRWWPWAAVALVMAGTAVLRWHRLGIPFERDEGEFGYMGQLILRGIPPYKDAANMKLPGVYYAYALIMKVFGETDRGVHFGLLIITLATIPVIYLLGRHFTNAAGGVAAAAFWALLGMGREVNGYQAQAEPFVILPALVGLLVLWNEPLRARRPVLISICAGLLMGVAFVMKQPGAMFALVGLLSIVRPALARGAPRRSVITQAILFTAACTVPYGLLCAYLYHAGCFEKFWFWTVTYARYYGTGVVQTYPHWWKEMLTDTLMTRLAGMLRDAWPIWLLATAGFLVLWTEPMLQARRARLMTLLLLAAVAVCPGLYFRGHYFLYVFPAVAVLGGAGVAALLEHVGPRAQIAAGAAAIVLPLVFAAAGQWPYHWTQTDDDASRTIYGYNPFPEARRIGLYLREHSEPGDQIAIFCSEPQVLFYARRKGAHQFLYTYPMMEAHPYAAQMQEDAIAQVSASKPRFLVFTANPYSWLAQPDSDQRIVRWFHMYADKEYEPYGLVEFDAEPIWGGAARDAQPTTTLPIWVYRRRGW